MGKGRAFWAVIVVGFVGLLAVVLLGRPKPLPPPALVFEPVTRAEAPLGLTSSDGRGLALVGVKADTVIDGPIAYTQLHLVFDNPEDRQLEGRFRLTLPPEAAISRFAMLLNGRWQEGELLEKKDAQRIYEDFLHRRQDPALLEQAAGNEFSARVFPIAPRARKELIVAYSERLAGNTPYRLALAGLPAIENLLVSVTADGGETLRFDSRREVPRGDVVVKREGSGFSVRRGDLALVRVVPLAESKEEPVESLLVLVDSSASRRLGFDAQLKETQALLAALAEKEPALQLTLGGFDQQVGQVYAGPAAGVKDGFTALAKRGALGATNLQGALRFAAQSLAKDKRKRLLLVTDGVATAEGDGIEKELALLAAAGLTRLDVLAVGGIRDEASLRRLVSLKLPKAGLVLASGTPKATLVERLRGAVAADVPVEIEGARWVYPKKISSVFAGQTVLVHAELEPSLPLNVKVGGKAVDVGEVRDAAALLLERSWAQAKIASLVEEERTAADKDDLHRSIVAISKKYRVMSPYTSLLVLETEADYRRYSIDRKALADILGVDDGRLVRVDRVFEEQEDGVLAKGGKDKKQDRWWRINGDDAQPESSRDEREARREEHREERAERPSSRAPEGGGPARAGSPVPAAAPRERAPTDAPFAPPPVGAAAPTATAHQPTSPFTDAIPEPAVAPGASAAPGLGMTGSGVGGGGRGDGIGIGSGVGLGHGAAVPQGGPARVAARRPALLKLFEGDKREVLVERPTRATIEKALGAIGACAKQVLTDANGPRGGELTASISAGPQPSVSVTSRLLPQALHDCARDALRKALGDAKLTSPESATIFLFGDKAAFEAKDPSEQLATGLRSKLDAVGACYKDSGVGTDRVRVELKASVDGRVSGTLTSRRAPAAVTDCVQRALATLTVDGPALERTLSRSVRVSNARAFELGASTEADPPERFDAHEGRYAAFRELLDRGKADDALASAERWVSEQPAELLAYVALGESYQRRGDKVTAARAYASLIDFYPDRADLRRYAGALLESLEDAESLALAVDDYRKVVVQRPDHPSSHQRLAYGLLRQQKGKEAFDVLAAALKVNYAAGRFASVRRVLAEDLGLAAAAWIGAEPKREVEILSLLAAAGGTRESAASLRFLLTWETDANDVDFHIYDNSGGHAFYSNKALPNDGGELYADVTTGFGPECFTIRGEVERRKDVYTLVVNYYARGPMGYGFGRVQAVDHDGRGGLRFVEYPFVVMKDRAFVDVGDWIQR